MSLPDGFIIDEELKLPEGFMLDSEVSAPAYHDPNATLEASKPSLTDRLSDFAPGLFGPRVQNPSRPPEGVLPMIEYVLHGTKEKPGFLRASPAMLMPEDKSYLGTATRGIMEQINPENIALLGGLKSLHAIKEAPAAINAMKAAIMAYFAKTGAETASQSLGQRTAGVDLSPEEKAQLDTNTALGGAQALGTVISPFAISDQYAPQGIKPSEPIYFDQRYQLPEKAGSYPNVQPAPQGTIQLPRFAQSSLEGKTLPSSGEPIQLPQMMSEPRFVANAQGQQVDLSQLTEAERTELLRGPRTYEPSNKREAYTIPTIGEQPKPPPGYILDPTESQAQGPIESAYQAAGEAKQGGQVSFEGQGIPNAGQQAQEPVSAQSGPEIAKELGLIHKEWPKEVPVLGGMQSFTDPATGVTIEGVKPNTPLEEVSRLMGNKLQENNNASTIRSNEGQLAQEAGQEGQATIQQGAGGEIRSSDLQRTQASGGNPYGTELRTESGKIVPVEGGSSRGVVKYYSNPFFDPDFWKQTGRNLGDAAKELAAGRKKFNDWVGEKNKVPRPVGWGPYDMATKEERAKAILGATENRVSNLGDINKGRQPGESISAATEAKNLSTRLLNAARKGDKLTLGPDVLVDMMDNTKGEYDGPIMQHYIWPRDDNYNRSVELEKELLDPIKKIVEANKLTSLHGERAGTAAIEAQANGHARLLSSGVTETSIKNIKADLAPAEKQLINAFRKMADRTFDLAQPVAAKLGITLNKVENYVSLMRDWEKFEASPKELALPEANKAATVDDVTDWIKDTFQARSSTPQKGFTIEREPNARSAVKTNLIEIAERHAHQVARFVTMAEHLRDIGEIVRSKAFQQKYGKFAQDTLLDNINTVAREGRNSKPMPLVRALRNNAATGVLAFRVASQIIHTVNVPLGMFRAGPGYWLRGLHDANTTEGMAWIRKNANEALAGSAEPGIAELGEKHLAREAGAWGKAKQLYGSTRDAGFFVAQEVDRQIRKATIVGVYQRLLAEKGKDASQWATLPVDKPALAQARVLARRAVASPLYKDVPNIMTKGDLSKAVTQFLNTPLDQWSNIRYDLPEYARHDPKKALGLLAAVVAMISMESQIKLQTKKVEQHVTGYHPKEQENEFYKKGFEELVKRVPGGSQVMNLILYGGTGIPIVDLIRDTVKAGINTYKAHVNESPKQEKLSKAQATQGAATILGVPGANQIGTLVQDKLKATLFKSHEQGVKEAAQKLFKKTEGLSLEQRIAAEKEYAKTKPKLSRGEEVGAGQATIASDQKRGGELQERLKPEAKTWLEQHNYRLPGYGNMVELSGTRLRLTEEEQARLESYLQAEYEKRIKTLANPNFAKLAPAIQKNVFDANMRDAGKAARGKLANEIQRRK